MPLSEKALDAVLKLNPLAFHPLLVLLEQDEVWTPKGSRAPIPLEDMSPSHRKNLLAWLERRLPFIRRAYIDTELVRLLTYPDAHPSDVQDAMDDALDELMKEQEDPDEEAAKAWFEDLPLVKRLRALVLDPETA